MQYLLILLLAIILGCDTGKDFGEDVIAAPDVTDIVCIEGHEYIISVYTSWGQQRGYMGMAPIFDENGKPKKCTKEEYR